MFNPPYDGATPQQVNSPLVRELLAVHNMFRAELLKMLNFANQLLAGQQTLSSAETTTRIHALIRIGAQYTHHLHMHHTLETSLLFPALEKEDAAIAPVVERLNADHDAIAVLIDTFAEAIRSAAALDPQVVDSDLRRLSDSLTAHLAYEETHICPLLARMKGWPF